MSFKAFKVVFRKTSADCGKSITFLYDEMRTVNCPSQETEVTSTPTRPVDNVVIATKSYRTETQIY